MTDREADDALVRTFLNGDEASFEELVQRHQARVYNVCLRMLGDAEEARDATQDTFLSALRKLEQFRGDAAFTTWLHRIAVNACYDVLRKQRRQPLLHLARDDDREPEQGPPISDHAEEVAGMADVSVALLSVAPEFRAALVLADIQDMPYDQIAETFGVPVGTVKSRVHRGRVALARVMGIEGPTAEPLGREPAEVRRTSKEAP